MLQMENMLYFLGDQEEEKTLKQCLNQVCHLETFICSWNKTKIQKKTGYNTHLGSEIFAQVFAFV